MTTLPPQYIQPPEERLESLKITPSSSIPIIDVSNWDDPRVQDSIFEAATQLGFFQIISHGIPNQVLGKVIDAAHAFYSLPNDERRVYWKGNSPSATVFYTTASMRSSLFKMKQKTELKQLKTKISHSEKEIKEKKKLLMSKREEAVSVENELNARKKDVDNVKLALESLPYEEGQMEALEKDRDSEMGIVKKLKDEIRNHSAHLSNVQFSSVTVILPKTLTGTKGGGDLLLRQLHELAEAESKLELHQKTLAEIEVKIKELMHLYKQFVDQRKQLELKMYDLSLFQGRAEQNEHHKLGELVKRIEQDLDEAKVAAEEKQILYDKCLSTVSELEKSIKEHDNSREKRLKDLEKKVKTTKAKMQSASKDLKGHEHEREKLVLEREVVIQEHVSLESQLATLKAQIDSLGIEVEEQKT
ncbi:Structural maintenance of chromosomes protein 2-2, partial [Linum perenne]